MNVKIPAEVNQKIQRVAEALKASKTEVVIALLNEGLDVSEALIKRGAARRGPSPAKTTKKKRARKGAAAAVCSAADCKRPAVAKGLCAKHYQADRRRKMEKSSAKSGAARQA
jgi:hypothetical protein